jgi:hypothetical protein
MQKIIQFFLLLVFFTFQTIASANSIPIENINSLPDLSDQENTILVYDHTAAKLIWINPNLTTANLAKSKLSTLSENNSFTHLPNNPSDLLRSVVHSKVKNPNFISLVSLTNPLSVVISHLNTSQINSDTRAVAISAPSSLWLVMIGLFALRGQTRKRTSHCNPKLSKQLELLKYQKNTLFSISSLQKKITSRIKSKAYTILNTPCTLIYSI